MPPRTEPATKPRAPTTASPTALDSHLLRIIAGGDGGAGTAPPGADRRRADRYRRFLDALGVAVYTTDADGRITFFNAAAAQSCGRRPALGEEWCGSLRLLWPDGSPRPRDDGGAEVGFSLPLASDRR